MAKNTFTATFKNGETITRKTDHEYNFAWAVFDKNGKISKSGFSANSPTAMFLEDKRDHGVQTFNFCKKYYRMSRKQWEKFEAEKAEKRKNQLTPEIIKLSGPEPKAALKTKTPHKALREYDVLELIDMPGKAILRRTKAEILECIVDFVEDSAQRFNKVIEFDAGVSRTKADLNVELYCVLTEYHDNEVAWGEAAWGGDQEAARIAIGGKDEEAQAAKPVPEQEAQAAKPVPEQEAPAAKPVPAMKQFREMTVADLNTMILNIDYSAMRDLMNAGYIVAVCIDGSLKSFDYPHDPADDTTSIVIDWEYNPAGDSLEKSVRYQIYETINSFLSVEDSTTENAHELITPQAMKQQIMQLGIEKREYLKAISAKSKALKEAWIGEAHPLQIGDIVEIRRSNNAKMIVDSRSVYILHNGAHVWEARGRFIKTDGTPGRREGYWEILGEKI